MIDKGKYASHGAFIKRLPSAALARRQKAKLAVIHPVHATVPRTPQEDHQLHGVTLESKALSTKFRFQENVDRKPVSQQYSQPFLYIEKVIKKQKVQEKISAMKTLQPFITSSNMKPRKTKHEKVKIVQEVPVGFNNLYEYQEQKRKIAGKLFHKMFQAEVHNLKDTFLLWSGKSKKHTPEIDIKEEEFVDFIKEIMPGKIAQKQIRRFFELYMNKTPKGKEKDDQFRSISIKALSFNYEKYRKSQIEVAHVLSEKALKQRYISLKTYLTQFDKSYPDLKEAMNSIKNYQEALKNHFHNLFNSYKNPYETQIAYLKQQLQRPIIKYDKMKKTQLTTKVQTLTAKNDEMHAKLSQNFQRFKQNYDSAILPNHDLFFTKRTLCKLLLPIMHMHPTLTRRLIEQQVALQQDKKQQFLQCLSQLVVQIDKDKKHLAEDNFTLDEFVQMVLMKNKNKKGEISRFSDSFLLYASKKLIKEVKKQFLLKYQLAIQSMQQFPADQQISLDLLHTCFQMQCSKVLLKNQIWTQLLNFLPQQSYQQSKLHQHTIDSNICLELIKRYMSKLDERTKIQLNKSKQISLLAENVTLEQFQMFATVFQGVVNRVGDYVQEEEENQEVADRVQPLGLLGQPEKKRVSFLDVVDKATQKHNFPEKYQRQEQLQKSALREEELQREREQLIVKTLIKNIYQEDPSNQQFKGQGVSLISQLLGINPDPMQIQVHEPSIVPENLADIKTLARSFYVPDGGLNTNAFDIRYYQKQKAKAQLNTQSLQPQVVRMGSSILLSNLPPVQTLQSLDPLKISRLLLSNIDKGVKQQKKIVREQQYDQSIRQGVDHNYYNDKIKLENKPTRYDSQGKSKYSVLLPVGYYENFVAVQNVPEKEKWYLRPHHVETLTENPLSKKDNIIHTEYQSKLEKLPLKKRPEEYVIQENVQRKSMLIQSLEQRLASLRHDLAGAQRGSRIVEGAKVPSTLVDNYFSKLIQNKEDKDLQLAGYEGVLYDLRRKERDLLNGYRGKESAVRGEPEEKWWEKKDKDFNVQLKKERLLQADSMSGSFKHREYVDKLKNSEIY